MASGELEQILKKAHKDFGEGIGGKGHSLLPVDRIKTGMFALDLATGGGFPRGKTSIIYGPESSGKTTIAYNALAFVQNVLQMDAVLIDIENSFDPVWAEACGINVEKLVLLYPETAEVAVDLVDATIRAESVGLVVLDSIGSMITYNEVESDAGKQIVGGSAQIVSKMMRKVGQAYMAEAKRGHQPALICINQIRHKIGVMFGDPEGMPGGNLLKFASSMTLRVYGKDKMVEAINKDMPVLKTIKGILKKWKVPILAKNFECDMCTVAHDGMTPGDTESWNTVVNYLKLHGTVAKHGTGWVCFGEEFKTLAAIKERYMVNQLYRVKLQQSVVDLELGSGQSIPAQVG